MLFVAKCMRKYQDKNGNDWYQFQNDFGEFFSINARYLSVTPAEGERCICRVKAVINPKDGKAFLAYDCVHNA